jgi:hypothetical protein
MPDADVEAVYRHPTTGKLEWRYRYCVKRYALNSGTRVIKLHLVSAHDISESSPRHQHIIQRQKTIQEAIAYGEKNPRKRRFIDTDIALDNSKYCPLKLWYYSSPNRILDNNYDPPLYSTSICHRALEQLYINFQISCNQPFSLIQAVSFRSFIRYINPTADNLLPESPSTTKALIMEQWKYDLGPWS